MNTGSNRRDYVQALNSNVTATYANNYAMRRSSSCW
jgi:hypothetical protein